jgi:hypothetical protein
MWLQKWVLLGFGAWLLVAGPTETSRRPLVCKRSMVLVPSVAVRTETMNTLCSAQCLHARR